MRLNGHRSIVSKVMVMRNGRFAISAGGAMRADPNPATDDFSIRIWDLTNGKDVVVLEGHTNQVGAMFLAKSGKELFTLGFDNTIRRWELPAQVFDQPIIDVRAAKK
jgi:WD40 repeat protein